MMISNNILLKPKYTLSLRCVKKNVFIYYIDFILLYSSNPNDDSTEHSFFQLNINIFSQVLNLFQKIQFSSFPKVVCGDIFEQKDTQDFKGKELLFLILFSQFSLGPVMTSPVLSGYQMPTVTIH